MKIKVLLVEDNQPLAEAVTEHLEMAGLVVDYAADGHTGTHLATKEHYDVLVLDVMLPGMDGFAICQRVRNDSKSDVPVIFLTARDQIDDKLSGFDAGGDDYLVKPFNPDELVARIHSLVKRFRGEFNKKQLTVADLSLDLDTMEVQRDGQTLKVSPTGIQILKVLMNQSPKVISKERLSEMLWDDATLQSDVLRSHLYLLRKVVDKPFDRALIQTVPGLGVKIE